VQPGRGWFPLLSPLELVQHQLFGLNAALVAFAGVYRSNDENQTSPQNLGLGTRPHRSGSEGALGKSQGTAEGHRLDARSQRRNEHGGRRFGQQRNSFG